MELGPIKSTDSTTADAIWGDPTGGGAPSTRRLQNTWLSKFYADEISTRKTNLEQNDVWEAIRQLRKKPDATKKSILHPNDHGGAKSVIDYAVRLMFMTACQAEGTALGSYNIHDWNNEETLVSFLDRVYPQASAGGTPEQSISMVNLRANALSRNTGVEIGATSMLSDHLSLVLEGEFKKLLVFQHRAFLEHSLDILKDNEKDKSHSAAETISLGCLPPALLKETLRTLEILFPQLDDTHSRRILEKWVKREHLDPGLLETCRHSLSLSADTRPPEDLHALYMEYPYWAPRLARLLKEVDEPTPTTRLERHADRNKSGGHMYICALAALIVAAVFGILATALAAVQVWISYCAWVDDPMKPLCGAKKTPTPRL